MESRKVQRVGYSTFSVSLPKEWVKETGIKQGDLVMFLPEKSGSLRLMPSTMIEQKKETEEYVINSDLCDEPDMLERLIVGNYTLGRDVFRIVSSTRISSAHGEEIRKIIRRLIGLSIVEETQNQIVLQCSIDQTKFRIDTLMRRLSVIASTMHSEAVQALVEFNEEFAEDAIRREDEADMMYWLAIRLLLSAQWDHTVAEKIGLEDPRQIIYYGLIMRHLESIADYAENIARRAIEFKKSSKNEVSKRVIHQIENLSGLAQNIFLKAMDCFFNGDIGIANNVLEISKLIEKEHERLMKELPELPILMTVAWGLARIADNGAGIAVIAINRALEKPSKVCSFHSLNPS